MFHLLAIKNSLQRSHERGQRKIEFGPKGEITNDYTIRVLAEHYIQHLRRSNAKRTATVQGDLRTLLDNDVQAGNKS
jgi:hypothetical protein